MEQHFKIDMTSIYSNSGFYVLTERFTGLNKKVICRSSLLLVNDSLQRDQVQVRGFVGRVLQNAIHSNV